MKSIYKISIIFIILFSFLEIHVSASNVIRGDVNSDGIKNAADAIYLLRHTVMPNFYPINQSADMNGDGNSTSADAIYLLRHIIMPDLYPLAGAECKHIEQIVPEKAATCTETGLTEGKICTVCGETLVKQEVISAKGHHYSSKVIDPTCTEKGYTKHTCVCGEEYIDSYARAYGHNYNSNICNTCGETIMFTTRGLSYSKLSDGTYAVYASSIASLPETVIIPPTYNGKPVTQLRYVAFRYANQIKTVMMPNTITKIDWEAFSRCASLENVYLPEGLISLEHYAFLECSSMEYLKLPESLQEIDHNVFIDCASLKELDIPAKTTSIGLNVFFGCSSLEAINIASANPNYKSIDGVLYNKTATILHTYPSGKKDESFTIPSTVKNIGSQAMSFVENIKHITISDSVTTIKGGAFYGCAKLESIYIGRYVSTIEHSGYTTLIGGCPNFTTFTVHPYNWDFKAVDGILYNKSGTKLLIYPVGRKETHLTLPRNITSIGSFALAYANNLESVLIPNNIKNYDGYAFYGCQNLKTAAWEEGCTRTGDGTFYKCENLITATLPSTITLIDSVTFMECISLQTVNIPDGVTKIEAVAFGNCEKLKTITIPKAVTFIGQYAFSHCYVLNHIYYQGTQAEWNAITKETDWIRYVKGQINVICTDGTIRFSRWH
ncbi:MAG: leucine-rich repeat protein [Clostridia bacterium]|nr:leucine-rich repeat protein [Clostridia bacterium]